MQYGKAVGDDKLAGGEGGGGGGSLIPIPGVSLLCGLGTREARGVATVACNAPPTC